MVSDDLKKLKVDTSMFKEKPNIFYKYLGLPEQKKDITGKRKEEEEVRKYFKERIYDRKAFFVYKRWVYNFKSSEEFVVRPFPEKIDVKEDSTAHLAFICELKGGALRITNSEFYPDLSVAKSIYEELFEVEISADEFLQSEEEALKRFKNLPTIGVDIEEQLEDWKSYLDWRDKLAEDKDKQYYEYEKPEKNDAGNWLLNLECPYELDLIKGRLGGEEIEILGEDGVNFQEKFITARFAKNPQREANLGMSSKDRGFEGSAAPKEDKLIVEVEGSKEGVEPPQKGSFHALMVGEISSIKIQREGLRRLVERRGNNPYIRDWIFNHEKALPIDAEIDTTPTWVHHQENKPNERQKECVSKSLLLEDLLLLWGPPGTGKTTVIGEITSQYCCRERRVLISSQANMAVSQALDSLPKLPHIRPFRVVAPSSHKKAIDKRDYPCRWLISMLKPAEQLQKAEKESCWKDVQECWLNCIEKLEKEAGVERYKNLSNEFMEHYIEKANVIGATCLQTGKTDFCDDRDFDLAIVDEVSKATPPELLLPALLAERTILVGDHRQLPPVFRNSTFPEAIENGVLKEEDLEKFEKMVTASIFKQLIDKTDPSVRCDLKEQYRMHPQIMEAVNQFYADEPLLAGGGDEKLAEARSHKIKIDLNEHKKQSLIEPKKNLIWVNSEHDKNHNPITNKRVGFSRSNEQEAEFCVDLLDAVLDKVDQKKWSIAIISLYRAQANLIKDKVVQRRRRSDNIRKLLIDESVEHIVNTVDQFQGSERDVVILSLTRTDPKLTGEFVKDFRRINVAISRAKKVLVIVGNSKTFDSGVVKVPSEDKDKDYESKHVYEEIRKIAEKNGTCVNLKSIKLQGKN